MSFGTEIYSLVSEDASVAALVGTNVYGQKLDDNFDISDAGILLTYNREEGIHALDGDNVLEIYTLYVTIIAVNTATVESIETAVRAALDDYSDSTIRDVVLEGETNTPELEKDNYLKTLRYRIIYEQA